LWFWQKNESVFFALVRGTRNNYIFHFVRHVPGQWAFLLQAALAIGAKALLTHLSRQREIA